MVKVESAAFEGSGYMGAIKAGELQSAPALDRSPQRGKEAERAPGWAQRRL